MVEIPAEKSAFPDRALSRSRAARISVANRRGFPAAGWMLVLYWPFGRDFALRASEF